MVYGATREGPRPPVAYVVLVSVIGALALVTGVIALVAGSAAMLAMLAASMAGLWVIATARTHADAGHHCRSQGTQTGESGAAVVTVRAVNGFPAEEFVAASKDAGLIVLGSRGISPIQRLLLWLGQQRGAAPRAVPGGHRAG